MIWLTWRQHRVEAYVVGGVLAVLAMLLILTGRDMASTYQQLGVGACLAHPNQNPNCGQIVGTFLDQYGFIRSAVGWLNLIPALIGILVGAPLVARELEHGTQHLVWTQSVTRWRWLAVKLALILGAALLASALLTILLTWWRWPFDQLGGSFAPAGFDFEGTVPLAYIAFALALAIAAGTLLRRAIPAMVVTLAGFLAVRLPIEFWLRPMYQSPLTSVTGADPTQTGTSLISRQAWVINQGFADYLGHQVPDDTVFRACFSASTKSGFFQCVHAHGWLLSTTYQPADRFWTFQSIETGAYVALALALLGLTIWWVRRRLS